MKFFKPELVFGGDDFGALESPEWRRLRDAYRRQTERLSRRLRELAYLPGVDDGLIVSVHWQRMIARLTVALRCGDAQMGYFDLELMYRSVQWNEVAAATLARLASATNDSSAPEIAFHELDHRSDGWVEHRILFHGESDSVNLEADRLEWRTIARLDRTLPEIENRWRLEDIVRTPAPSPMQLGVGSYTWPWAVAAGRVSAGEIVERAASAGFAVAQLCDNLPLRDTDPDSLRLLAERLGVRLELGVTDLRTVDGWLSYADQLGAKLLRIVVDAPAYEPDPDTIIAELRRLADPAESLGVTLAIENHDRLKARTLAGIVEAVDRNHVGVCLDTANSLGAGEDLSTVLDWLAPLAVCLHVKDVAIRRLPHKMGFTITGAEPGSGQVELDAAWDAVRAAGRCESAILEQWPIEYPDADETIRHEERWASAGIQWLKQQREPNQ